MGSPQSMGSSQWLCESVVLVQGLAAKLGTGNTQHHPTRIVVHRRSGECPTDDRRRAPLESRYPDTQESVSASQSNFMARGSEDPDTSFQRSRSTLHDRIEDAMDTLAQARRPTSRRNQQVSPKIGRPRRGLSHIFRAMVELPQNLQHLTRIGSRLLMNSQIRPNLVE